MSITIYHYLAVVLVALAVVAALLLGPARRVDEARPDVVVRAARAVRTRNLIAFVAALVVGVTAVATGWGAPGWDVYQQIVEVAPFAGASAALLAVIVHPTAIVPSSPGPRTAELVPRGPTRFASRGLLVLTVVVVVLAVAATLAFAVTAAPDGRSILWVGGDVSVRISPYPGLFYGGPALIALAVVVALAVAALARIARAPRPTGPGLDDLDTVLRRRSARLVLLTVLAATAVVTAFHLLFGASALSGLAQNVASMADVGSSTVVYLVAGVCLLGSLALGLGAVVAGAIATVSALRRPAAARAAEVTA